MDFQIPVEHMFTLTLEGLGERSFDYVGPFGRRRFEKASGGTVSGAALNGRVLKLLNSDYGRVSGDGSIRAFNASVTLQAEDGAVVLMQYRGRASPAYGAGQSRIQVLFQAPEGTYGWFNGVQAIGYGREEAGRTVFEIYWLTCAPEAEGPEDASPPAERRSVPAEFLFRRKSEHNPGAERHVIPAPLGARYLTLAEGGGGFAGPKIGGEFISGYSWSPHRVLQKDDKYLLQYDVETLLETSDGAPVLMSYTGAMSDRYPQMAWMTGTLFETPEGPHAWLNGVQAVGVGRWAGDGAEYKVYALR